MRFMKKEKFFLVLIPRMLTSCSEEKEEGQELDQMVILEDDVQQDDGVLAGEPSTSPQELIIHEKADLHIPETQR